MSRANSVGGPPGFCRNPHYGKDPARPLREVMQSWPPSASNITRERYDNLWRAYSSISGEWSARSFSDVIGAALSPIATNPELLAGFVERFRDATLERATLSSDVFRQSQVCAALAVSMLPYIASAEVRCCIDRLVNATGRLLLDAGSALLKHLQRDPFCLLATRGGGISELFYLPIRISKVLGWMGAAPALVNDESRRRESEELFASILQLILEHYSGSIVSMSDAQAPYWAIALSTAARLRLGENADELAGRIFASLTACGGRVARWDIAADSVFNYVLARSQNAYAGVPELVERPNETLTVLLKAAPLLELDEVFDHDLWKLDGVSFAAYLNPVFTEYGGETMNHGRNLAWAIGHDVFRVSDLVRSWPGDAPTPPDSTTAASAVLGALLFPDRTPWFCLEPSC